MKKLKMLMCTTVVAAALQVSVVQAQGEMSRGTSNASSALSDASGLVVHGSLTTAAASGKLSVAALNVLGESTVLVLRTSGNAMEVSVQVASQTARDLSLGVGSVVHVVADVVGYALIASGRLIAYIPNEMGRSLLYQARLK